MKSAFSKIFFLALFMLASAACFAQTVLKMPVSLSRQSGTVGQFLSDLNQLSGVSISYSSEVVDLGKKVQLSGNEKTLEDVLRSILRGQSLKIVEQNGKVFLTPGAAVKKKFTISGYISDRESGERLIGASVFVPAKNAGTTSNVYGFFSITLEQDSVQLQASYAGYFSASSTISLQQDTVLNITLERNIVMNEMVIVNAEGKRNTQHRALVGKTDVSPALIKSMSALMGEADVLKTLQLLPGIQAGNEGTAGLNVRGGSADQTLILLDGVPVYNASHAFGLFSVFNADAVNNIEVLKSGFPASYGGRLSSVVDVHMREGDKYKFHGEGGIGLIFSKLTLEGPIKRGKSSFLFSARRTYADLFIRPVQKIVDAATDITPFFGDVNAKANFPIGSKDRLYFSLYLGQDKLRIREKDENRSTYDAGLSWGNVTALTRWNHVFSKKIFSNFTLTHSRYKFKTNDFTEEKRADPAFNFRENNVYFSGIQDWSVKADIDFLPTPNHFIKLGVDVTMHRYEPGISHFSQKDSFTTVSRQLGNHALNSTEYNAYIEDDIKISGRIKANMGVRFSAFALRTKTFTNLQPRINLLYKLNTKWNLKASYGSMSQYIHLLTNGNIGLPTDLWVPVTERVPPQLLQQYSAGVSYSHDRWLEFSMEAYYKSMKNVIDYGERSGFSNVTYSWEEMLETGRGTAYGLEWLVQKKKGSITGLASYTLSKSTRQFANINNGKAFPFKYDRRHELKAAVVWQASEKLQASANWFYLSGAAVTMPSSYYFDPFTGMYIDVYTSRNESRMPDYHRLDVSMKFIKQKRKYTRTWVLSIYNVYSRLNSFYRYKTYEGPDNKIVFKDVTVFPVLPSISYQFKF
jgi:outer membrane receptor for ferrienterochelin and colicin